MQKAESTSSHEHKVHTHAKHLHCQASDVIISDCRVVLIKKTASRKYTKVYRVCGGLPSSAAMYEICTPSPPRTLLGRCGLHGHSASVALVKGPVVRGQLSARPERARKAASHPLDRRGHARLLALLLAGV